MEKERAPSVAGDGMLASRGFSRSDLPDWLNPQLSIMAAIADGTGFQDLVCKEPTNRAELRAVRRLMDLHLAVPEPSCEPAPRSRNRLLLAAHKMLLRARQRLARLRSSARWR